MTEPYYLNAEAAARYAGYCADDGSVRPEDLKRFYDWASRHGVKKFHAGRRLRFRRVDLDVALDPDAGDAFVERALQLAKSNTRGKRS